jgi:hypothetical protein
MPTGNDNLQRWKLGQRGITSTCKSADELALFCDLFPQKHRVLFPFASVDIILVENIQNSSSVQDVDLPSSISCKFNVCRHWQLNVLNHNFPTHLN